MNTAPDKGANRLRPVALATGWGVVVGSLLPIWIAMIVLTITVMYQLKSR